MKHTNKHYFLRLVFSVLGLGTITGVLTAVVITLYKLCAEWVITLSEHGYSLLREHLYLLPVVLLVLGGVAWLLGYCYKKTPNLRGGGIPTSIGILRGVISFHWLRNLIGVFALSLTSFLIGVPLGNEGPSVQIGTAVGRGTVHMLGKKRRAWDRYSMTGGACAGFSVATGAPISGILFAIEEAHQRLSPMILLVAVVSVIASRVTTELLAPLFGVSVSLFPALSLPTLSVQELWIPLAVGLVVGLFSVLVLRYYRFINNVFRKRVKRFPHALKIFAVLAVTVIFGLFSSSLVSTGHHLILSLFESSPALWMLVLLLILRTSLTLCANAGSITGGLFVPMLALGTVMASLLGQGVDLFFGLSAEHYTAMLILGITACIAGMMKMPLTAIVFSVEALSCHNNILAVVIAAAVAFAVTELFGAKSINEKVLKVRMSELNKGKTPKVIDTFVTVQPKAFAIGKQIRDIFWPANLFVLSVKHDPKRAAEMDEHGEKVLREGDVLHVRYATVNERQARDELLAIVGDQSFDELETDVV